MRSMTKAKEKKGGGQRNHSNTAECSYTVCRTGSNTFFISSFLSQSLVKILYLVSFFYFEPEALCFKSEGQMKETSTAAPFKSDQTIPVKDSQLDFLFFY